MVLNDNLGIRTLQFRLEGFCIVVNNQVVSFVSEKPFEMSVLNRLNAKPEPVLATCVYNQIKLSVSTAKCNVAAHLQRPSLGLERTSDLLVKRKLLTQLVEDSQEVGIHCVYPSLG